MAWHRLIRMPSKDNFFFHFTVESYENLGLISTLAKEGKDLILDCFTTMECANEYDNVLESLLKDIKEHHTDE